MFFAAKLLGESVSSQASFLIDTIREDIKGKVGQQMQFLKTKVNSASLLLVACVLSPLQAQTARTVMDGELGGMFVHNSVTPWNQYGAYIGVSSPYAASLFDPAAIKVNYTRFHVHKPSDDNGWSYFPFAALKSYEASEVAAGRPPIFVTATYQGKKRPVLWSWSLGLSGQTPTWPQQNWQYAVNVGDERFIRFWLNQYLRPKIWQGVYDVPNLWWGLDESAFLSSLLWRTRRQQPIRRRGALGCPVPAVPRCL